MLIKPSVKVKLLNLYQYVTCLEQNYVLRLFLMPTAFRRDNQVPLDISLDPLPPVYYWYSTKNGSDFLLTSKNISLQQFQSRVKFANPGSNLFKKIYTKMELTLWFLGYRRYKSMVNCDISPYHTVHKTKYRMKGLKDTTQARYLHHQDQIANNSPCM